MSIEIISKQIKKFLSSNTPEVLSIKGKWGIGKTFLWNKLIKENKDKISLQKYSYVSLFGVNSLEQLKVLIFENMLDKKIIGEKPSIDTFNSNRKSLLKSLGGKSVSLLKFVPWIKNFVPILDSLLFLSVSNIIICLDDFERKAIHLISVFIQDYVPVFRAKSKILRDEIRWLIDFPRIS